MKPSTLATVLPLLTASRRPVFIHGKAGVGKSSVIAQVVKAMGRLLSDTRLSQLDSIDLRGFPMPDAKTGRMIWLPASFLPGPKDKAGVLFLDEFNGAPPAVQSPAYQLILDHRIGDYVLPDNWSIIAAGNGTGDRGVTHRMAAPLNNRFLHIDFDVDSEDWLNRAREDGIHEHFRAFLSMKPAVLHVYDPTIDPRSFPTPRTWYVADELYRQGWEPAVLRELLGGTVGEGAAGEFLAFVKNIDHMPAIADILANPKTAMLPGNTEVTHTVITTLVDHVKAANYAKLKQYVDRLSPEVQMVFNRLAVKRDENITGVKEYGQWCIANRALMGVN